jgi:inosine-uridine nucleoside N-ribohydrolase
MMTDKALIPVLLDCDPGNDDIFAILWAMIAHQHNYIDLQGITTLGGNVSADLTYRNALRMKDFTGINVPVGKDLRPVEGAGDASHIHGADGIGGLSDLLPQVHEPDETLDSVQMIIDAIQRQPGQLTLLVTGPMTNLAAAERKVPGILSQAKYIIAMGGSFHE